MKKIKFQINDKEHMIGIPDITVVLLVILILYDALLGYTNTLNPAYYIACVICACGIELTGATRITWWCANCGYQVEHSNNYCSMCGHPLKKRIKRKWRM